MAVGLHTYILTHHLSSLAGWRHEEYRITPCEKWEWSGHYKAVTQRQCIQAGMESKVWRVEGEEKTRKKSRRKPRVNPGENLRGWRKVEWNISIERSWKCAADELVKPARHWRMKTKSKNEWYSREEKSWRNTCRAPSHLKVTKYSKRGDPDPHIPPNPFI